MSRTEFLELLARAVREKVLAEQEAVRLLQMFDAGELKPTEDDLPLPLALSVRQPTEGDVRAALLALVALGTLRQLYSRRREVREALQDRLRNEARRLAKALSEGGTVRAWQEGFRGAVTRNIIQQRAVGAGRVVTPAEVAPAVIKQSAYIARFTDEVSLRRLAKEPPSYLQMAARSALYAGAGRAESYRAEAEGREPGTFVRYESQDDDGTCGPCLDAEGVYPVSEEFPVPGAVCLGGGNCRCRLEYMEAAA